MKNEDLLISIIIPYYKAYNETIKLLETLIPQLTEDTEVLLIDDGCHETRLDKVIDDIMCINVKINFVPTIKVIHLVENSGGASIPRNIGLDIAKGKYIAFIDSDDLVSDDYIQTILNKTKEEWDYCYISWKGKSNRIIIENEPPKWNCCVWNCIYKRDLIGNERFKHELKMAEDYDFNKRVRKGKRANITKIIYYYNEDTPNSLTKQGELYNNKYKGDDNNAVR
jgi:glycosyltransferase involved in cell wall biosynthesis